MNSVHHPAKTKSILLVSRSTLDYLDPEPVAKTVTLATALTQQHMLAGIEMEIIAGQLRNMHQPLHINAIKRHKKAKTGYAADNSIKRFTDFILHVITFKPRLYIAGGIVRAALCLVSNAAQFMPVARR